MLENKTIIIDLNESSNAKSFKEENVIHQNALISVKDFINEFKEDYRISKKENKTRLTYKHNTITILGTRGSGKTSFLLSIEELITNDKNDRYEDLLFLDIIDPTLVEEKGHVFLNIISSICDEVQKKLDNKETNPYEEVGCLKKKWKGAMNKLAKGLPSIDGIGGSKFGEWHDAEFVMQNELQSINSARNLAKYFAEFIECSLSILDKEQFVLFFDDIDVDSSKGYAVLETIRKYFVSDQLITFLSGDLKLYDALVRDKKWSNFGNKLITFETSREYQAEIRQQINMAHYNDMVTDLTSQYLIKIMQPKYRVHLSTLYNYYIDEKLSFSVKGLKWDNNDVELDDFLKKLFKEFGIESDLQRATFIEFLLRQPLRSIVHFLQYFKRNLDVENTDFTSVFLSDLYEKHVDVNALQTSLTYFIPNILQVLIQERKLKESYQLIPSTLDNSFNATMFTSTLLFSNHINNNNKSLIFEYFYKIAYLRNFAESEKDYKSIEGVLRNSGILTDDIFRDSSNQLQSSLYGQFGESKKINEFGLLRLLGLASKAKQGEDKSKNRIDYVLKNSINNNFQRNIALIPCFVGQYSRKNATDVFYSVISLISTIGELCKRYEKGVLNENNFSSVLNELSQIRYYSINETTNLKDGSNEPVNEDSNVGSNQIDNLKDLEFEELKKVFFCWLDLNMVKHISPYLLGKIFTRFYYSLIGIGNNKNLLLGDTFNLQILAFFNAIMIEEAREKDIIINFNYDNIVSSTKIFKDHINKISFDDKKNIFPDINKLSLTYWMLSCPLFLYFIDNQSRELIIDFLRCYSYQIKDPNSFHKHLFNGLNKDIHYEKNNVLDYLNMVDLGDSSKTSFGKSSKPVNNSERNKKILQELEGVMDREELLKEFPNDNRGYEKEKVDKLFKKYYDILNPYNISGTGSRSALAKVIVRHFRNQN